MARTQALSAYTFFKLYTFSKFSTYHTNAHTPIPTLEYIWALGTEQKFFVFLFFKRKVFKEDLKELTLFYGRWMRFLIQYNNTRLLHSPSMTESSKLQALVYDILPFLEEGAGKRCSECAKAQVWVGCLRASWQRQNDTRKQFWFPSSHVMCRMPSAAIGCTDWPVSRARCHLINLKIWNRTRPRALAQNQLILTLSTRKGVN